MRAPPPAHRCIVGPVVNGSIRCLFCLVSGRLRLVVSFEKKKDKAKTSKINGTVRIAHSSDSTHKKKQLSFYFFLHLSVSNLQKRKSSTLDGTLLKDKRKRFSFLIQIGRQSSVCCFAHFRIFLWDFFFFSNFKQSMSEIIFSFERWAIFGEKLLMRFNPNGLPICGNLQLFPMTEFRCWHLKVLHLDSNFSGRLAL